MVSGVECDDVVVMEAMIHFFRIGNHFMDLTVSRGDL